MPNTFFPGRSSLSFDIKNLFISSGHTGEGDPRNRNKQSSTRHKNTNPVGGPIMNDFDITNKTVSAFTMYKFLQDVVKPFKELNAFKDGLINEEGYFTGEEGSIPTFDLFVLYTKRLFDEIPNPATKSKLGSFTAAMDLFREHLDYYGLDSEMIVEGIKEELLEQEGGGASGVHANSMGGNFEAGQVGEPGNLAGFSPLLFAPANKKKKKKNPLERIIARRRPIAGMEGY